MRHETGRAPRSDLEIVRDALVDEGSIAQMKDWRNWVAALALVALAFAYVHMVGWVVTAWM